MSQNFFNPKFRQGVDVGTDEIKYIVGRTTLNISQVKQLVEAILQLAMDMTIVDMETWISKYVPKRTGFYRQQLILNLNASKLTKTKLKMRWGTILPYIKYVNKMDQSQVRHMGQVGYAYYNGYAGKLILDDPQAVEGAFNKGLAYMRVRLKENLKKAKDQLVKALGQPTRPFTDKLKVKTI